MAAIQKAEINPDTWAAADGLSNTYTYPIPFQIPLTVNLAYTHFTHWYDKQKYCMLCQCWSLGKDQKLFPVLHLHT